MKCKECKYWMPDDELVDEDGAPMGMCHRYPPTLLPSGVVEYPITFFREWCGEFAQKLDG